MPDIDAVDERVMNSSLNGMTLAIMLACVSFVCVANAKAINRNAEDFDALFEDNNLVLVNFHEPWCEHCSAFDAMYDKLAVGLQEDFLDIKVVRLDTEGDIDLLDMLRIKTYPQIVLFVNGLPVPFKDAVDVDRLRKWVKTIFHKGPIEITNTEQLDSLYHPIYYLFTADETSERYVVIDNLAKRVDQDLVLFTTNHTVMNDLHIQDNNTLYVVRHGDKRVASAYMADYTAAGVYAFIDTSKHDLMKPFDVAEFKVMVAKGVPVIVVHGDHQSANEVTTDLDVYLQSKIRNGVN